MRNTMRKTLIAATAAITLAVTTIAVPTVADARWGGGWLLRVFIWTYGFIRSGLALASQC